MNVTAILVATVVFLASIGLMTWVAFAAARVSEELHGFRGFEGMHFELAAPEPVVPSGTAGLRPAAIGRDRHA